MKLGKVHTFSIIMVRYENGGTKWYKAKRGRSINGIVNYFSGLPFYKWLKIFEYSNNQVGRKYFYHTSAGKHGFE